MLACICSAKGNVTRLSDQTAASLPASELDFHYGSPYTSFHANVWVSQIQKLSSSIFMTLLRALQSDTS